MTVITARAPDKRPLLDPGADPELERMILEAFTEQSDRGKQVKIGPSEIGGCAYCVGHTLSQKTDTPAPDRGDNGFGYASHIGTMCHYWIENHFPARIEKNTGIKPLAEHKVEVFELEGYGTITGTCDLWIPGTTFDWKFPGKWSYDNLVLRLRKGLGPSDDYRYQQQLYAHGFRKMGMPVEKTVIVFFPRHSNRVQDIKFYQEDYNPEMVEKAIERLETIWLFVQQGELTDIPSDPNCYTCNTYGR